MQGLINIISINGKVIRERDTHCIAIPPPIHRPRRCIGVVLYSPCIF